MRPFDATQSSFNQWIQWLRFGLRKKLQHWWQIGFRVIKQGFISSCVDNRFTRSPFLHFTNTFSQLFTPFRQSTPIDAGKLYQRRVVPGPGSLLHISRDCRFLNDTLIRLNFQRSFQTLTLNRAAFRAPRRTLFVKRATRGTSHTWLPPKGTVLA